MDNPKCETCRFYVPMCPPEKRDPRYRNQGWGMCHRRAPVRAADGGSDFAHTTDNDWCGEHEVRSDAGLSQSKAALQELADEAQELDMGY